MKLMIQIPCLNEEKTLPLVLADIPRSIPGVDSVEILVVDDGSTDDTVRVARELGVQHIVQLKHNQGLARAFTHGVQYALAHDCDILVNLDGDNQYKATDIPRLIAPVLEGRCDMVIGCRPIEENPEFSWLKKRLQRLGSWVLRNVSGTTVRDATSGFRAYSREALLRIHVLSEYTYTLETIIQAGLNNIAVDCVDIGINPKTRESRLFRSIPEYLWRSAKTIISILILYRANLFFGALSAVMLGLGMCAGGHLVYLHYVAQYPFERILFSLGTTLFFLLGAMQIFLFGIIASMLAVNRKMNEEMLYRLRSRSDGK